MDTSWYKRMRTVRMQRGITQLKAAQALDMGIRSYQRYEEGSREPSIAMLVAIADMLDVSIDYLMGREKEYKNGKT